MDTKEQKNGDIPTTGSKERLAQRVQYRYVLVALVFFGYVNAFTIQSNLGVVIVAMVKSTTSSKDLKVSGSCPNDATTNNTFAIHHEDGEFEWDEYTQGIILGAFFYGYFAANIIGGRVTELLGVKWTLGIGILISSVLTLLTPVAARCHYIALIVVRVIEGISQLECLDSSSKAINKSAESRFVNVQTVSVQTELADKNLTAPTIQKNRVNASVLKATHHRNQAMVMFNIVLPLGSIVFAMITVIACHLRRHYQEQQGSTSPAVNYITGRWFHKKERGFLYSIMKSGINVGTVGASLMSGFLVSSGFLGGWPLVFYVFGLLGLIWCVFWFLLMYENPDGHPYISREELNFIMESVGQDRHSQKKLALPWKSILTSMPVWSCVLIYFSENWGYNLLMCDQPTFMRYVLNYNIQQNGALSALPPIAQTVIAILSGWLTDFILSRTSVSDTVIRKWLIIFGSALPAVCLIAVTQSGCNRAAVIILLTLFLGLSGPLIPGVNVTIVNMAPLFSGTITGIANGFGEISGFLSPYIVGVLTQKNQTIQQWNIVFYIGATIYIIPCLVFIIFGTSKLQEWSKNVLSEDESRAINLPLKPYNSALSTQRRMSFEGL